MIKYFCDYCNLEFINESCLKTHMEDCRYNPKNHVRLMHYYYSYNIYTGEAKCGSRHIYAIYNNNFYREGKDTHLVLCHKDELGQILGNSMPQDIYIKLNIYALKDDILDCRKLFVEKTNQIINDRIKEINYNLEKLNEKNYRF